MSLTDIADLDSLVEELRDVVADTGATSVVLFVEEDDEYLAIVRLDGEADPRVFLSDVRAIDTSAIAAMLYEEAAAESLDEADDDDAADDEHDGQLREEADPAGDNELLADLG